MDLLKRVSKKKLRAKHWSDFVRLLIVGLLILSGFSGTATPKEKPSNKHKITVQAKLSQDKVKAGSVCFALLIVNVQDGWHINSATPADNNLVATSVDIQKKTIIDSLSIRYPPAEDRKFDFAEDLLAVYEGTIKILVRMQIQKSTKPGSHLIPATVSYQACSNSVCLAPTSVRVNIPVRVTNDSRMIHEINKELFRPYTLK